MCCREDSADDEVAIDQCDSFFGDESQKGGSVENQESFPDDEETDDGIDDSKPQGMFSYKYRDIMFIGMGLLIAQQYSGQPGSHSLWVAVKKNSGKWITAYGAEITLMTSDWAHGEPNATNDCAVAQRKLG